MQNYSLLRRFSFWLLAVVVSVVADVAIIAFAGV